EATGDKESPAKIEAAEAGDAKEPAAASRAASAAVEGGPTSVRLMGRTDVGLIREHNEDSFVIVRLDDGQREIEPLVQHDLGERGTLLVVCDGMGGAAAGEVASGMAIEALVQTMCDAAMIAAPEGTVDDDKTRHARKLRGAAREANARIFREARENLTRSGMGTTMTAMQLWRSWALIAQVGDSRAYVWRQGVFTQVTRDQSLVNQLLETGQITVEQAKFFEHSNVILQALGVQEEVEVQLSKVDLRKGDRLLLCSDGLVGVVSDEEIAAVMGAIDDPDETARILIEMANGAGGPDNITVIVAHVDGAGIADVGDDDAIHFAHWRIDPDAPEQPVNLNDSDDYGTPTALPTMEHRVQRLAEPRKPTAELMSMAVVVGLILGSIVTGAALYRHGVHCAIAAPKLPGAVIVTDGRDSGARTGDNAPVELRLMPGHHTIGLRSGGLTVAERSLDVLPNVSCDVSFTESAPR
ncbi:MAG TPA: Stp1/IreP family PP2C-type Ser/Thr phosphatase, partial [Polyangia bacterium]|nr:Stp1/IreP family PP2C-type Ser/Thr phosphatase [Polyangia bacterium]